MDAPALVRLNQDLLKRILEYETDPKRVEDREKMSIRMFWDYGDVNGDPMMLHQLYKAGILALPFGASGKRKTYCLKNREELKKMIEPTDIFNSSSETKKTTSISNHKIELPDDLFSIIQGFDDIKTIFKMSLRAEKPVHILLEGPPGCAKTLFLMEIERLQGAKLCLGGTSSRAGMRDLLLETPRYLLIDEIEKINAADDLAALLSWMENGRIVVTKFNQRTEVQGIGWVFAAANTRRKLAPELLSRFTCFKLSNYVPNEFKAITKRILVERESTSEELAAYIAEKASGISRDVRDSIKIARLAKTREEVDTVLTALLKHS